LPARFELVPESFALGGYDLLRALPVF